MTADDMRAVVRAIGKNWTFEDLDRVIEIWPEHTAVILVKVAVWQPARGGRGWRRPRAEALGMALAGTVWRRQARRRAACGVRRAACGVRRAACGGVRRRGGWVWSALYQQRPSPEEGLLFDMQTFLR